MPELPEVQTIVNDLNKKVKGLSITDVWTDWPKYFRRLKGGFEDFKEDVKNKRIEKVWRLGKNIIFDLSGDKRMLIHQKMTGHLLIGIWNMEHGTWVSKQNGLLADRVNGYIHAMFWLSNGTSNKVGASKMMGFSDLRKFGKILTASKKDFAVLDDVRKVGPDPLQKGFGFTQFKSLITKKRGPIKKVLMDQNIISGIGNIYADEILFVSKINPLTKTESIKDKKLKIVFEVSKKILKKAIRLRGTSTSDYRDTAGKKGGYGNVRLVYQREGEKCLNKCGGIIKRIKVGGRSAHFCPNCQKI